jgi:hypothetical protein
LHYIDVVWKHLTERAKQEEQIVHICDVNSLKEPRKIIKAWTMEVSEEFCLLGCKDYKFSEGKIYETLVIEY